MDENSPGMFQIIIKRLQHLQWNTKTKDGHTEKIGIILPLPLALVPRGIPCTVSSFEADKESKRTPVAFTTKDSSSPHCFLGSLQPSILRTWTVLATGDFNCWSHWEPRTVYVLPLNHSPLWPTPFHSPATATCTPTHPQYGSATYPADPVKWHHGLIGTQNMFTKWASPHVPRSGTRPRTTTYTPAGPLVPTYRCKSLPTKASP